MFEQLQVWKNGEIIPWGAANVHIMSHGFSRGSAIFDFFGIYSGPEGPVAFRMDKHLDRLFRSTELLGMRLAYSREQIIDGVAQLIKANSIRRGVIKIFAYYGEESVTSLVLDSDLDLTIFAIPETEEMRIDQNKPVDICFTKWRKIHPSTVPVEAKACANYLNGMLARQDAFSRGFDVGIFLTTDGYVAEGSIESIFIVKDNVLKTPFLGNILQSITRMSILEAAPHAGIKAIESRIPPEEALEADEIFVSRTGKKILPVGKIEERVFDKVPGAVTSKLYKLMDEICNSRNRDFIHWLQPVR